MLKNLQKLHNFLIETFTDLDIESLNGCIEYLEAKYITKMLSQNELSGDDIELLELVGTYSSTYCHGNDIMELVQKMANITRERSHGAATLAKCYISEENYNKILEEAGIDSRAKIMAGRIEILSNDDLTQTADVVGLCTAKFKGVDVGLLVISGYLNNSGVTNG